MTHDPMDDMHETHHETPRMLSMVTFAIAVGFGLGIVSAPLAAALFDIARVPAVDCNIDRPNETPEPKP